MVATARNSVMVAMGLAIAAAMIMLSSAVHGFNAAVSPSSYAGRRFGVGGGGAAIRASIASRPSGVSSASPSSYSDPALRASANDNNNNSGGPSPTNNNSRKPKNKVMGVSGFNATDSALYMSSTEESSSIPGTDAAAVMIIQQEMEERTERINQVAFINTAVVGTIAISVLYTLLHERIEAILALYEYGLGPHGPQVTMAGVALDLMARLPTDAIAAYEKLIPTNPVFYKACTSGVAYALGDFLSQIYQGRTLETIDLPRSARSGAAGFIAHGPLCHYWLLFMETYLDFDGAWWATGIKVTADLTVWSIFLNAAYSTIIGLLAFRSPMDVFGDIKVTLWPALRSAWRFWPFVHTVSFSHAVPLDLKLLWVDVMEVVWVTILSKVANEDKNAKLREHPEAEVVNIIEPFNVDPALEIELTREQELDANIGGQLSFELPKKVLGACWPLIAMWPVLYAGYQIENALGLIHTTVA